MSAVSMYSVVDEADSQIPLNVQYTSPLVYLIHIVNGSDESGQTLKMTGTSITINLTILIEMKLLIH